MKPGKKSELVYIKDLQVLKIICILTLLFTGYLTDGLKIIIHFFGPRSSHMIKNVMPLKCHILTFSAVLLLLVQCKPPQSSWPRHRSGDCWALCSVGGSSGDQWSLLGFPWGPAPLTGWGWLPAMLWSCLLALVSC